MKRKLLGQYTVIDPEICHGKPTFLGTRIMVAQVLGQVAKGMTWDHIVEQWRGDVPKEAIAEALELARQAFVEQTTRETSKVGAGVNILDENIPEDQRRALQSRRIPVRQIGKDLGRKGMKDQEIIPYLRTLSHPTFFSLDYDFFKRILCHPRYCLVYLEVEEEEVASFIVRILRHPEFNTKAKRLGSVIRVIPTGLWLWKMHAVQEFHIPWKGTRETHEVSRTVLWLTS